MITIKQETRAILNARYTGQPIDITNLDLDVLFSESERILALDAKHDAENEEARRRQMDLRDIQQRNFLKHGELMREPAGTLAEDFEA